MADEHPRSKYSPWATRLGLTSFGGPVTHLGHFHKEYSLFVPACRNWQTIWTQNPVPARA